MTLRFALQTLVVFGALAAPAFAQADLLLPANRVADAQAGRDVAIDGDTAVLGVPGQNRAVVFERGASGWTETANLQPSNSGRQRGGSQEFGFSVAVAGDLIVVGEPQSGVGTGAVYVFERENGQWTQVARFAPSRFPTAGDMTRFGFDVAIKGEEIIVGAPLHDFRDPDGNLLTNTGAAYIYSGSVANGFTGLQFVPDAPAEGQNFGSSVDIDFPRAVVGAFTDDGDQANADSDDGAAFVFSLEVPVDDLEAVQLARLVSPGVDKWFGNNVAIDGDRVLIGTAQQSNGEANAYTFTTTGSDPRAWTFEQALDAGTTTNDGYASGIDLQGSRAAVTARLDDGGEADAGAVYLFTFSGTGWSLTDELRESTAPGGTRLGTGVSLSGDFILAGAWEAGGRSGAAFVFEVSRNTASGPALSASGIQLSAPAPNPATATATLTLSLDAPQRVRATLVDALGRTVRTLLDGPAQAESALSIEAAGLAAGTYLIRVEAERGVASRVLTITR